MLVVTFVGWVMLGIMLKNLLVNLYKILIKYINYIHYYVITLVRKHFVIKVIISLTSSTWGNNGNTRIVGASTICMARVEQ